MKAILLRRPGGPDALEYTDVPTPVPSDDEVLVKADTIGVSMPEVLVRRGTYAWMPPLPAIPGIELSGTIVACGRDVTDRAVGEAVFVSARDLPVRAGCDAPVSRPWSDAMPRAPILSRLRRSNKLTCETLAMKALLYFQISLSQEIRKRQQNPMTNLSDLSP